MRELGLGAWLTAALIALVAPAALAATGQPGGQPTLLVMGAEAAIVLADDKVHVFRPDGEYLRSGECELQPLHWSDAPDGFGGQSVMYDARAGEFFGLGTEAGEGWRVFRWDEREPCPATEFVLPPSEELLWFVGRRDDEGRRLIGRGGLDRGLAVDRITKGTLTSLAARGVVPYAGDPRLLGVVAAANGNSSTIFLSQIEASVIPDVLDGPYLFCSLSAHACFFSDDGGKTWSERGALPETSPPVWRRLWRLRFSPWDQMWYAFVEANDEENGSWYEGWRSNDDGASWQRFLDRSQTMQNNERNRYFAGPFFNDQGVWIQLNDHEELRGDDWVVRVLHFPADGGEPRWLAFEAPSR